MRRSQSSHEGSNNFILIKQKEKAEETTKTVIITNEVNGGQAQGDRWD